MSTNRPRLSIVKRMMPNALAILSASAVSVLAGDLADMLGKPKIDRYEMGDGAVLLITRDATHDTLKAVDGQIVTELGANEVVSEGVQSQNKKFLLCCLDTHRGFVKGTSQSRSLGMDFSGLARITHSLAGWKFERVWKVDRNEWVRDLGAISDDGQRALFKVGRKSAPVAPYSVSAAWQTWDLDKNLLLKTGLTVE